jgi:dTDP-4-dehydrorhamnose reductase
VRTLVLGGTGMLGRAVLRAARRRGFAALGLSHAQADLTDRERLLYWAREFRPELVVNAAAYTKVDAAEADRDAAFAANALALDAVTEAAAVAIPGGAVLLQVSTDYVFDGAAATPYAEDAPTRPLSVYGESKLEGERRALRYGRTLVVRTSWLFGPGGPNFAATIAGHAAAGKPLRVVDDQRGGPTYTPHLAAALLDLGPLAVSGALGKIGGILHYRDREPVTWYGFACEIVRLIAGEPAAAAVTPVTTAEFPRPAARPAFSVLDVSRFEAAVGRRVQPWAAGLAEYLPSLVQGESR